MRSHKFDFVFFGSIGLLLLFGLLMLFSASSAEGLVKFQYPYFFIKRQILFGLLPGLVLFYLFSRLDYHFWGKISRPFLYFSLLLLVMVLIPGIGDKVGVARSWFVIKDFSFQPAELFKLALIVYLAAALGQATKEDFIGWRKRFASFITLLVVISVLMLLQPDLGTLMILLLIAGALYFVAGGRLAHLAALGSVGIAGLAALFFSGCYPRVIERITIFLNPSFDPQNMGYHINQALLAIGSGGLFGLGWGRSRQKFQYLPEARADSIFAVIAEELGFVISLMLVAGLIFIFWRGLRLAKAAPDNLGKLIIIGVMVWLVGQSFVNMASMAGLLPLTGLPLPLVSHGGSALAIMLAALGVAANVSRQTKIA